MNYLLCFAGLTLLPFTLGKFMVDDCWEIGFNKANLPCSHCDLLPRFNLDALREPCGECCHPDETTSTGKLYAKAVLEVCTCKFGAYPQIQAFIKSDRPGKFENLQIKYVRGLDPIIKLYDKDGHLQETVAIEKWNTESVVEYLNTYLDNNKSDYLRSNMV